MALSDRAIDALRTLMAEGVLTYTQASTLVLEAVGMTKRHLDDDTLTQIAPPKRAKKKRNGVLHSTNAQRVSRSIAQFCRGKDAVTVPRSELAKRAAKIGITTDKYIEWMVSHHRGERLGGDKFKLFSVETSIKLLDPRGRWTNDRLASDLGVHNSVVSRTRREMAK